MSTDEIQNIRRAAASRLDLAETIGAPELSDNQARAVLSWWHSATGGLKFSSHWCPTVGIRAYNWGRARIGADARGIDGVERIDSPIAAAMTADLALFPDWVDPMVPADFWEHPGLLRDQYLTELDVNGQFLNAAGVELGTGEPDLITAPRTLDGYLRMPGWIRLARKPDLAECLPFTAPAFARLDEGRTMAMPTVRWLVKMGVELDASEIVIWPRHRRHLAAWQTLFRNARNLLAESAGTNLGAYIALCLVKEVTNVMLGGWLRSEEKNHSDLMRKDWSDQIITEGVVRALVSVEAAGRAGYPAVGMWRDAAWFIGPRDLEPYGLEIDKRLHPTGRNGKLGKWKRTRSFPFDERLCAALGTGSASKVVRVLSTMDREFQGQV